MITGQLRSKTNKMGNAERVYRIAKPGRQQGAIPQSRHSPVQCRFAAITESVERQKARHHARFSSLQHRASRGEL
jgi:hypothetical protein